MRHSRGFMMLLRLWLAAMFFMAACPGDDPLEVQRDVRGLRTVLVEDRVPQALEDVDRVADDAPIRAANHLRSGVLPAARSIVERLRAVRPRTNRGRALQAEAVEAYTERTRSLESYLEALEKVPVDDDKLAASLRSQRQASKRILALDDALLSESTAKR